VGWRQPVEVIRFDLAFHLWIFVSWCNISIALTTIPDLLSASDFVETRIPKGESDLMSGLLNAITPALEELKWLV
jgi:hypothetical protein